jgi:VRR-NUC domain
MPQPEATFKQRLTKCFAKVYPEGWWTYLKPVKAGIPDLVFTIPGFRTVWVEAKADRGVVTPIQQRQIALMQAAGMTVVVLTAHMTQEGRSVHWRRWSITIDFQDDRRGMRVLPGGLMDALTFWETALL